MDKPNFVMSPHSILAVFHMAQTGAEGQTKEEMDALVPSTTQFRLPDFRQVDENNQPTVIVEDASRLYAHEGLEGNVHFVAFRERAELLMDAGAETLDFSQPESAAARINSFVNSKTRGRIPNIIDPSSLDGFTRLVLVNALYFKAPWYSKFDPALTKVGEFHALTAHGPELQTVMFIEQKLERGFNYYSSGNVEACSIMYSDYRLSMYIFVPKDIEEFEARIADAPVELELLARRVRMANATDIELNIRLPKFRLGASENGVDLVDIFQQLGVVSMFDPNLADFSGISGKKDLHVSGYVHQADITVDEQGTEAAAATGMLASTTSLPMPKPVVSLNIDRPFIFQIRYEEDDAEPQILFSGRISDAKAAQ